MNNLLFHNRQSHSCYIRSALYLRNISFSAFCDRSLTHCSVITAPAVQKRCSEGTLDCGAPRYVNASDARKRNLALLSLLATMQACHCSEVQVTQLGNSPVQYGLVEDELVGSCSVIWLLSLAALVELVCASSSSTQSRKLIWDDSARQGFFQLNSLGAFIFFSISSNTGLATCHTYRRTGSHSRSVLCRQKSF